MTTFIVFEPAAQRIEDIYDYTTYQWSKEQADRYVDGLFDLFAEIARRETPWRRIPARLNLNGYYRRYERHIIYWRELPDGVIGIVSVLHERMDLPARLRDDIEADTP